MDTFVVLAIFLLRIVFAHIRIKAVVTIKNAGGF